MVEWSVATVPSQIKYSTRQRVGLQPFTNAHTVAVSSVRLRNCVYRDLERRVNVEQFVF